MPSLLNLMNETLRFSQGLITIIRNRMLAINVPTKIIAGAGLFSSTDSLRKSSKDLKPSARKVKPTKRNEIKAMIGPQKAIMLIILGRTSIKLFHEAGA